MGRAAAAGGKCGTGEGDNGQTWGPGTVAKDYGMWGKAHGTRPAQTVLSAAEAEKWVAAVGSLADEHVRSVQCGHTRAHAQAPS